MKKYYKCGSVKKISEQFHTFFDIDRELHKSVIEDRVSKFETYGTAVNLNKKSYDRSSHSGQLRTRTQQIVEMALKSVEQSPKRSLRRRNQSLNLSMSTTSKVMVADLNKYPYRIQTKQKLTVTDKKDMAEKMAEKNQKFELAPHSPDFSPPAFFLWGYLKDRVFSNKPKNISEVKVSISEEIRASPRSVCKSVTVEFRNALEKMYGFK